MTVSIPRARQFLKTFTFEHLFVDELGWESHTGTLAVTVGDATYALRAIAQKRGVQIFECAPDPGGKIPDYATRRKVEKQVAKSAYEHLLIFIDGKRITQVWQWVLREPGRPAAYREHHYHTGQTGDLLIQKFGSITFPLSAEESLSLTGVVSRLRDAFDRDRLTKRFYDQFKTEHAHFLGLIKGISDKPDREWYASLMLNRLMFIWFIQQKCFLDGDPRYLQNRLILVQSRRGEGMFLSFYRLFLRRLFHEGFAQQPQQRSADLEELLGRIPYLNGGLFEVHELEESNPEIDIADDAFERIFAFFGQWEWHLDERPLATGREINPDVLGYIFEKYINQKQMGAFYTKQDITGYIGKSTIIPYLFDTARKKCAVAFEPGTALWRLLREDPDRYIYEPMRRGIIDGRGAVIPESALPDFVQTGMHDPKERMLDRRYNLAEADFQDADGRKLTLPTETWREYIYRRQRCLDLRERLESGEIHEINDLITLNLDIRQFAEDVISSSEGPELLRAFYQAIRTISVLDPTSGSGAFLFAALNILETLYEACLDRMQVFLDDLGRSGDRHRPEKFSDFRKVLADVEKHPNRRYFILKSIMVNNLYGVDIMEEAVEICKLRLFLKLVSQVEREEQLEPLPDIDFNIRAGNTLVGFVSREEVRRAAESKSTGQVGLPFAETGQAIQRIEEEAEVVDRAFQRFHEMQTKEGMGAKDFATAKQELRSRLHRLSDELDRYLAKEYEVDPQKAREYQRWKKNHQPFHWFAEFYGIMHRGGFNVIMGNPPYVEYSKVRGTYLVNGYVTEECGNLYAFVLERAASLVISTGRLGFIIPIALVSVSETSSARTMITRRFPQAWFSNFAIRPAKLFDGVEQRLTIWLATSDPPPAPQTLTTKYHQWYKDERSTLFSRIEYSSTSGIPSPDCLPKLGSHLAHEVVRKVASACGGIVAENLVNQSRSKLFFHRTPGYWIRIMDFEPYFQSPTATRSIHHIRELYVLDEVTAKFIGSIVSSSMYFFWFFAMGNCRNLTLDDVKKFPVGRPSRTTLERAGNKFDELMQDFRKNSFTSTRGNTEYQEFNWSLSKPIIDRMDVVLGEHFGLTIEEVDFVTNYDIKIRMGKEPESEDEP